MMTTTYNRGFSCDFVATWKDGQMPRAAAGNVVVNYDQTNHAYEIDDDDMDDFIEWVADNWQSDYDPREFVTVGSDDMVAESAQEYLDRRGISIRIA